MDYPLWKNSNFWIVLTSCFYCLNRRFSLLEYRETYYVRLFCLKQKAGKSSKFSPKPWTNPFKKCSFLDFIKFFFLQSKKAFFLCRISLDAFSCPMLPQIKREKNFQFFDKTHGLSLWKNSYFWIFSTSCFYCLKRRFSLLVYREKQYSGLFCLEQKDGRFQIFDKNHGLSPSEKS